MASARRISPRRRKPAAKAQWTSSALGAIGAAEIVEQAGSDREREEQADDDDEQRRLDQVVVEAELGAAVEEDDPVRLQDPPDDPAEDRDRPEELDRELPPRAAADALTLARPLERADDFRTHPASTFALR